MGIIYWMLPLIRGRALWSKKMALWQIATWTIGMFIFGHGMGAAGLHGLPRRTDLGGASYIFDHPGGIWLDTSAVGGAILFVSAALFYINVLGTLFLSKQPVTDDESPITTKGDPSSPLWLDRWWLWVAITVVLGLIAWGPVFASGIYLNAPLYNTMGSPMR
jgi:cytochrome c oxidase subunit 1